MKTISLFVILITFSGSAAFSQGSITYTNFEDINLNFGSFMTTIEKVANPSKTGLNTSDNVGKTVSAAESWEGIVNAAPLPKIDFTGRQIFKMKVFSPRVANTLIKLEYSADKNNVHKEVYVNTTKIGQWEELSFDFSNTPSGVYDNIVIFFDIFGVTPGENWYFDELKLVSSVSNDSGVSLPGIFSSDMVLQQNMDAPVWGFAPQGEKVTVTGSWGESFEATADADWKWSGKIKTPAAVPGQAPKYTFTATGSKNSVVFENVLIGDVWVCSGQSNMEFPMTTNAPWTLGVNNFETEIAAANYPEIRLFKVPRRASSLPETNCGGSWVECSPATVATFSAAAYYFGKELYDDPNINIPIGLIQSAFGGSAAQAWTKQNVLAADAQLNSKYLAPYLLNPGSYTDEYKVSNLYNGMIAPLIPFGIRGATWYQGESNKEDGDMYRKLCAAMLNGWRTDWKQGDFPFYYVQVAPYAMAIPEPMYAEFREVQFNMLSETNTGMAVTMDIGEINNIHPRNKLDVGKRLALCAKAKTYGEDVIFSGPVYESASVEEGKMRIKFKPETTGTGLKTNNGSAPVHFTIAGSNKTFYPATAEISENDILVSSTQVPDPVTVRYAFSNAVITNLMNSENLPAVPFRTDGIILEINDNSKSDGIEVFPNPFDTILNIKNSTKVAQLELTDLSGKVVLKSVNPGIKGWSLNTTDIPSGLYILKIQDTKERATTVKVIKKK
ncbi:MAG: sialate O-acetylesterase [Bacteroidales bacterium]|nr:sialate O-acetylesterase [Bacteroidales bacterium]